MKQCQVTARNQRGLHARAASQLVKVASRFNSEIRLIKDHITSDAKSILGILLLAAPKGTVLTVQAEGEDEEEAVRAIQELFERGFYESDEDVEEVEQQT